MTITNMFKGSRGGWIAAMGMALALPASVALPGSVALAEGAHTIVDADEITWSPGPPSIPSGTEAAVLYGSPGKAGLFALRLKLPSGYHIPPHVHPKPEIVTVISGTFQIGMGKKADPKNVRSLKAGSFFAFDPGMAHYAYTEGETVIQLNSTGPWNLEYIDPADDPRKKAKTQ